MIVRTVDATTLGRHRRLDSLFFCSEGTIAADRIATLRKLGVTVERLGEWPSIHISAPNRFKRSYSSVSEESIAYLRPYDVFEFMPQAADLLSVSRTENLERYKVERGTILQTCSGRNLGPVAMADSYIARFALSHDLIRLFVGDDELRWYLLTYLSTPTGQALLRRDKTGSVIDHLSVVHLEQLMIPMLNEPLRRSVSMRAKHGFEEREAARLLLETTMKLYEASIQDDSDADYVLRSGWTVDRSSLALRLDAAPYSPNVRGARKQAIASGGVPLGSLAEVHIPGRYVRYYVDKGHGTPILSGRQLLQEREINLRYISERSFRDISKYRLRLDSIAMQAEGRAEERIGFPVLITQDREGWLANNHVARIVPKDGISSGALFLALACSVTQQQIKGLATGSVVDAVGVTDLEGVVVPALDETLGAEAARAWQMFSSASEIEREARADLEAALCSISDSSN